MCVHAGGLLPVSYLPRPGFFLHLLSADDSGSGREVVEMEEGGSGTEWTRIGVSWPSVIGEGLTDAALSLNEIWTRQTFGLVRTPWQRGQAVRVAHDQDGHLPVVKTPAGARDSVHAGPNNATLERITREDSILELLAEDPRSVTHDVGGARTDSPGVDFAGRLIKSQDPFLQSVRK